MPPLPLTGVRVVDLSTGPVGGLATMALADFGADVVKVEPPGGDRFRSLAGSPLWLRGKRSVVADLGTPSGRATVHKLVRGAEVLLVAGPEHRARDWGLDPDGATALQPSIVHCSVTGWGPNGPLAHLPGYVGTVAARAGRMHAFAGQVRRDGPVYAGVPVAVHAAAHGAVQGIVSALLKRRETGRAQAVATSLLQGLLPFDLVELLLVQLADRGDIVRPVVTGFEMPTLNYHPVLTADGKWIQCGNLLEHLFVSFLDAIDLYAELLGDERFLESPALWSPDAIEVARDRILTRVRERSAAEWMTRFAENGNVAAEPFRSSLEALDHPDLVENGAIIEFVDPLVGKVRMIGAIAQLSSTPAVIDRPAPLIGADSDLLAREPQRALSGSWLPVVPSTIDAAAISRDVAGTAAEHAKGPLHGRTVIEFASVIAGPLGTSMLADLGARVIRVEPIEGDSFHQLPPVGMMTVKTTAGKESICIDLKQPVGRALALELIAKADVLVHNYRIGVPERLGIGFEELHAAFPQLVWVSVNGYGARGPGAHRPATHPVAGASMGGAAYQAGSDRLQNCSSIDEIREIARQLLRANEPSPDPNTSVIVGSATLLALAARSQTGVGQAVFVDMLRANAHANADDFLSYPGKPDRPVIDSEHLGTGPLHRLYAANDGWVFLTITTEREWQRLCDHVARSELIGAVHFDGASQEIADPASLIDELASVFSSQSADDLESGLGRIGVACVRADGDTPGAFYAHHEQLKANGFAPWTSHSTFGTIRRWGPLVTVNGPKASYGPGVHAGEHTDAILRELGQSPEEIASLHANGIIARHQPRS